MTPTLLPSPVHVEVESIRESALANDEESVLAVARGAVASGVADAELAAKLANEGLESTGEESTGGLWRAVTRFLTNTTIEDRKCVRQSWRWPLFVIGCPNVDGAQMDLTVAKAEKGDSGLSVRLFGYGFDKKATLSVTDTVAGVAKPGQYRILFTGVDVDVIDFDLLRSGRLASSGQRFELAPTPGVVGWIDLPAAPDWLTPSNVLMSLNYSGAAAGSAQQWSRQVDQARTYQLVLGDQWVPITLGATLAYELTTSVNVKVTLPGGRTWNVVEPQQCAGTTVVPAGK